MFHLISLFLQIVEEAGGAVSRMDGGKFCVYDRSVIVSNGLLHSKVSSLAFFSALYCLQRQYLQLWLALVIYLGLNELLHVILRDDET